jgi:3-phytase
MRNLSLGPLPALLLSCSLLIAAASPAAGGASRPHPTADIAKRFVPERYVSAENPGEELDSLATWRHPDGTVWLIATAKTSHRLVVFDADTGARLRDFGAKGAEPGRFKRPNGIAVLGDRLFVTERDNHRVQAFALPDFRPLGSFGESELRAPYGLWLNPLADGTVDVYVTDNFMLGERFDVVPPLDQLDRRVRRYRLGFGPAGELRAESRGSFGDTGEANALRMVESIAGDAAHDRLLIADEYQPHSTLREYTLAGRATGRRIPDDTFAFEAEGVALWSCGRHGYWIAVDQLSPLTVFHVFDRLTLKRVGSLTGGKVSRTDGIALRTAPSPRFPKGALFAVHDDTSVAAFDLRDVAAALKLGRGCR